MTPASELRAPSHATQDVQPLRDRLKVQRIDARPIATEMVNYQLVRRLGMDLEIDPAMCGHLLRAVPKAAVAVGGAIGRPLPALGISTAVHLLPKPLLR